MFLVGSKLLPTLLSRSLLFLTDTKYPLKYHIIKARDRYLPSNNDKNARTSRTTTVLKLIDAQFNHRLYR